MYFVERSRKCTKNNVCWINLKCAQDKGLAFWQTRSNALILENSVPADCLEKVVNNKTEEILYQKIRLLPRLPLKVILKSVWLASSTRGHGETLEIGLRFQGVPHEESQQDQENSRRQHFGTLVHAMMSHRNEEALIAEMQSDSP